MSVIPVFVEFVKDEVKGFQTCQHEYGGCRRQHIHATTTSQTDGCYHPDTGCGGQTAHHILALLEDDGTGTDETDARHDLSGYT